MNIDKKLDGATTNNKKYIEDVYYYYCSNNFYINYKIGLWINQLFKNLKNKNKIDVSITEDINMYRPMIEHDTKYKNGYSSCFMFSKKTVRFANVHPFYIEKRDQDAMFIKLGYKEFIEQTKKILS